MIEKFVEELQDLMEVRDKNRQLDNALRKLIKKCETYDADFHLTDEYDLAMNALIENVNI